MALYIALCVAYISVSIPSILAQSGTECETDSDCFKHQSCDFGYCKCEIGYMKRIKYCFKYRNFGQDCQFTEQCQDFRLVCKYRLGDPPNIKRCICDEFFEWDPETVQCITVSNFTQIVESLEEKNTWLVEITRSGKEIFKGVVIAGIVAITLLLLYAIVCATYGCCFKNLDPPLPKDQIEKVKVEEVASAGSPAEGSYVTIPTDLSIVRI